MTEHGRKANKLGVLPDRYDNLFKAIVSAGWCVKSDGHVESPMGYFSITEIPSHFAEFNDMVDAVDPDEEYEWETLNAGWYVTVENSDGFIFVYPQASEEQAIMTFTQLLDAYNKWDSE